MRMIVKKKCERPDIDTERHTDRHISSTGNHWGVNDNILIHDLS